jgi:hypothetical protein
MWRPTGYLVDVVQALVRHELVQHLNCHKANVLTVFNLALAVAPGLAMRACQPFIVARAEDFLGGANPAVEAQWLRLSPAAAARVVSMDLEVHRQSRHLPRHPAALRAPPPRSS